MFPDSKIAASFSCKRNKTSRILSDGLGPHFRECVENEIRNTAPAFTLEIDEATTAKHWRQLEILVRFYSEERKRIVVCHLSSITLGRAQASVLASKIAEVATPLYAKKLLQISTDGPNVMKALTKQVKDDLNPDLIDIGSCNIHKVHNAFSKALDCFGDDVERLGIEIFYVFKNSPVRREEFEVVQKKFDIKTHVFLRHVETRWLTLQEVSMRLEEQLPAITYYFLQSPYITEKDKQKSDRIRRLVQLVGGNKLLLVELQFLKNVMTIFTKITRLFQCEAPLIHILYDQLSSLIVTLLLRFIKPEVVGKKTGAMLYDIDINNSDNQISKVDIGQETSATLKKLLSDERISQRDYKEFLFRTKDFYKTSVTALLKSLPLKCAILRDLKVLHPLSREGDWSTDAIRRLAVSIKLFPREKIDSLVDEWRLFRIEELPKSTFVQPAGGSLHEDDDDEDDDDAEENENVCERIDDYWSDIFKLMTSNGLPKYPNLSLFVKLCLTLSHGNADVERAFSENKLIIDSKRTKMSDETLNGYKATSSYMSKFDRKPEKLPISQRLLKVVRNSRQSYYRRMAEKKAAQLVAKPVEDETPAQTNSHKEIAAANDQIHESESLRKEGMEMLQTGMKKKDFNKVSAANAILEQSAALKERGEKRKLEAEKMASQQKRKKKF